MEHKSEIEIVEAAFKVVGGYMQQKKWVGNGNQYQIKWNDKQKRLETQSSTDLLTVSFYLDGYKGLVAVRAVALKAKQGSASRLLILNRAALWFCQEVERVSDKLREQYNAAD